MGPPGRVAGRGVIIRRACGPPRGQHRKIFAVTLSTLSPSAALKSLGLSRQSLHGGGGRSGGLLGGRGRLGRRAAVRLSKTGAQYAPVRFSGGKIVSRKGDVSEGAGGFLRYRTIIPRIASTAS